MIHDTQNDQISQKQDEHNIYHESNVPSRLSLQWLCGNSRTWAHDVPYIRVTLTSRFCHQKTRYISWQPDPHGWWMVDAFQINWKNLKAHTVPPFSLIGRVLAKAITDRCTLIIITSVRSSQPCYTHLLSICMQDLILILPFPNLLTDTNQSITQPHLRLSSMRDLGKQYSAKGWSGQTTKNFESSRKPGTLHYYKMGWGNWSSSCLLREIDPIGAEENFVLESLSGLFSEGL